MLAYPYNHNIKKDINDELENKIRLLGNIFNEKHPHLWLLWGNQAESTKVFALKQ